MAIMITVLTWLLWILLGVLALLVLLINMPYRARIDADWDETRFDGRAWIGWPLRLLGGLARASFESQTVAIYFLGLRLKSWTFSDLKKRGDSDEDDAAKQRLKKEKAEARAAKKRAAKKEKRPTGMVEQLYMMRMPHKGHALKQIPRWLFMKATLEGRFGFDDPYTNAQLAMALQMMRTALPSVGRNVVIDYVGPAFEGRLHLSMTVWLPRILVGAALFLVSREGRTMVRYYWARPKTAQSTS